MANSHEKKSEQNKRQNYQNVENTILGMGWKKILEGFPRAEWFITLQIKNTRLENYMIRENNEKSLILTISQFRENSIQNWATIFFIRKM